MYAKYFQGDMAFQTKVVFLGLPVYNSEDNRSMTTCYFYQLRSGMAYSWVEFMRLLSIFILFKFKAAKIQDQAV